MNLSNLKYKEVFPGLKGKLIHGKNISWAFWEVKKGSVVPEHSHLHEQIMYVLFFSIFLDSSLLTKIPEKKSKHFDHNFEILKICFLLGNKFVNKNRAGKKNI